jgi:hypothetical protein
MEYCYTSLHRVSKYYPINTVEGIDAMKIKRINTASVLFLCSLVLPVITEARSLHELERRCEEAREWYIAPLREAAIDRCIDERTSGRSGSRSSRDARQHCVRFYADFGQGGTTQSVAFGSACSMTSPNARHSTKPNAQYADVKTSIFSAQIEK